MPLAEQVHQVERVILWRAEFASPIFGTPSGGFRRLAVLPDLLLEVLEAKPDGGIELPERLLRRLGTGQAGLDNADQASASRTASVWMAGSSG